MSAAYREFGAMERQGWGDKARAAAYIELFANATDQAVPHLVFGIGATPGMRVLDLCCGQGNVAAELAEAGCDVIGADFSSAMIGLAKARVPNAFFHEADAQDLPFGDAEFDAVVSNFGISHVPDQTKALEEVRRVLRVGARFAMTVWCGPDLSPAFRIFREAVAAHGDPTVIMPAGPDTHRFADPDTASGLLSSAGFGNIAFRMVECYWDLPSPDGLAEIFERATVRAADLMAKQPSSRRIAIRRAMAAVVEAECAFDQGWRVAVPAALSVGEAV